MYIFDFKDLGPAIRVRVQGGVQVFYGLRPSYFKPGILNSVCLLSPFSYLLQEVKHLFWLSHEALLAQLQELLRLLVDVFRHFSLYSTDYTSHYTVTVSLSIYCGYGHEYEPANMTSLQYPNRSQTRPKYPTRAIVGNGGRRK